MRRLLILFSALFLFSSAQAVDVWRSSTTTTTDTLQVLCGGGKRGVYHGICVSTTGTGAVTVYNSSFTATGVENYGAFNINAQRCQYYDVVGTRGLVYSKTGVGDITMLYECY